MAKSKMKRKRTPKSILKLPDLEQSKSAVLNSLTSPSSQRTYDHAIREFIEWYCSEPRLAFNKTVVTLYRISLEQRHYASTTINPDSEQMEQWTSTSKLRRLEVERIETLLANVTELSGFPRPWSTKRLKRKTDWERQDERIGTESRVGTTAD